MGSNLTLKSVLGNLADLCPDGENNITKPSGGDTLIH